MGHKVPFVETPKHAEFANNKTAVLETHSLRNISLRNIYINF